jgi:hypothetical protein
MRRESLAGAYAVGVGLAMLSMWTALYLSGEITELATAPLEIGYHLTAEGLTAVALIVAGLGFLRGRVWAGRLLPVALGMLLYTVINSAGYYATLGEWPMVGTFTVLTVATGALLVSMLRGWHHQPSGGKPPRGKPPAGSTEGDVHA